MTDMRDDFESSNETDQAAAWQDPPPVEDFHDHALGGGRTPHQPPAVPTRKR